MVTHHIHQCYEYPSCLQTGTHLCACGATCGYGVEDEWLDSINAMPPSDARAVLQAVAKAEAQEVEAAKDLLAEWAKQTKAWWEL